MRSIYTGHMPMGQFPKFSKLLGQNNNLTSARQLHSLQVKLVFVGLNLGEVQFHGSVDQYCVNILWPGEQALFYSWFQICSFRMPLPGKLIQFDEYVSKKLKPLFVMHCSQTV